MEVINHQKRRNLEKEKQILYDKSKIELDIRSLELDHIIPYCISADDSINNLQLLRKSEHCEKSGKDRKIIKKFKDKGWIEVITKYSFQLNKSKEFLINEYKKECDGCDGCDSKNVLIPYREKKSSSPSLTRGRCHTCHRFNPKSSFNQIKW